MTITSKSKILIVEDEPAIAQDLEDILLDSGYDVVGIAYTYEQAIALLGETSPDLIFLDIALQGLGTGLDVAKIINEKYNIPFIFLTSFSDKETIQEVVSLNPIAYLVKPFNDRDIVTTVAVSLSRAKLNNKGMFPSMETVNLGLDKPLSTQEYKVLFKIWKGKKNIEIAEDLFVSINTIKTHVVKIYSKLAVNSRAMAINKVMQERNA